MATMADLETLVDLCVVMHEECSMHGEFSTARVRVGLERCLDRRGGVIGVIDGTTDDGERRLSGGIALLWQQQWYTDDWHWGDLFCYVRPDARSAHAWDALTDFAKWFVDQVSPAGSEVAMPLAIAIFQPPKHIEALCRLYRQKFVQVGGTFIYGNTSSSGRIEVAR
jgi:hypothetical protein